MSILAGLLQQAGVAGAAGGAGAYIEDVFSTYLYTGTGSSLAITNDIDLENEGGLVWIKRRSAANSNWFFDTVRGGTQILRSNTTEAQFTSANLEITSFNSDGFTLGTASDINSSLADDVSWTFRKAPKFFDVVTWTGDSTSNRRIPHNLGSTPGCVIVKCTSTDGGNNWQVAHRSLGNNINILLNTTGAAGNYVTVAIHDLSDTDFQVDSAAQINNSGDTYVAYVFAHDAGGFGNDGEQNVISCGSYTGTGVANNEINLGFEPQFVIFKNASNAANWYVMDTMRGLTATGAEDNYMFPNLSNAEALSSFMYPTSTGFGFTSTGIGANASGNTYIYIAIRRGPMKTPTSGTEVFGVTSASAEPVSTNLTTQSGVLADAVVHGIRIAAGGFGPHWLSRLTGDGRALISSGTAAESNLSAQPYWKFDNNEYAYIPPSGYANNNSTGTKYFAYSFNRAPGFMDVVCFNTGASGTDTIINHNLGVSPELVISRSRSAATLWPVHASSFNLAIGQYLVLNTTNAIDAYDSVSFSSTQVDFGTLYTTTFSNQTAVAYLFATLAGVSKVGSYTGTGTTLQVDCGFSAGARLVIIKRTDSTGDWYVWDSARGIVAGNDPYLLMNSTAAEVTNTDYIDPLASGFEISSTAPVAINADGGSYIFLAIA